MRSPYSLAAIARSPLDCLDHSSEGYLPFSQISRFAWHEGRIFSSSPITDRQTMPICGLLASEF